MSDKSTDDEAPEPQAEPGAVAYAPPTYGPPPAAAAPKKKLAERVFGWKSVAAAAAVGLVLGGGVAAGVVAVVVDGGSDQGPRELGQMRGGGQLPDFGHGDGGPGDFGRPQDQFDGWPFQGQSS
ncbi:hypothetical protein [Nocardioides sp. NPDC127503]|uniref:hypothetical protein n=1 Tax=Nocardioides sp. NPDC127503 TaxID=3154516 RepID=UPI0033298DD5